MSSFNLVVPGAISRVKILQEEELKDSKSFSKEGYAAGFDAGYKAGMLQAEFELRERLAQQDAEFQQRMKKGMDDSSRVLSQLEQVYKELSRVVSSHLPQLVLAALTRVFQHHNFTNEEVVLEVQALLKELSLAKSISVECCPDNLKDLREKMDGEGGNAFCQAAIEWRVNPDLKNGEYILRSDLGILDGRRIARMAHVQTALKAIL